MKPLRKTLYTLIITSEFSHLFCCVLPTIFSVLSLLAGLGVIVAVPVWLEDFHHFIHNKELLVIAFSGSLILLGWGLHYYSEKIDCHDTGCCHGPCEPKKKISTKILWGATILFLVNVFVFFVFHRGMGISVGHSAGADATPAAHSHMDSHHEH